MSISMNWLNQQWYLPVLVHHVPLWNNEVRKNETQDLMGWKQQWQNKVPGMITFNKL